jgi:peptide/nickel transport system substrate-binding protein
MEQRMRKLTVATGALAMLLAVAACGGSATGAAAAGGDGGTLTLAAALEAQPWDLADAGLGDNIQYYEPVFDSLVRLSPQGNPEPYLATSWSYDSTRTVLTMHLRTGVTFTDGSPLNAVAVRASLLHTETGSNEAAALLKSITGVDVVNPTTVAIHLSAPDPNLVDSLGDVSGMIASPKHLTAKNGPVGSGPYILDESATTPGSAYTYTRNPGYWNKKAFPFNKIVVETMTDATARLNALMSGQVEWGRINTPDVSQVKGNGLQVETQVDGVEGLYIWDRAGKIVPALGNVKVRQALNYAFNRPLIVSKLDNGFATPTTQMFTPQSGIFDASLEGTYSNDPAKARQLLAEAGYPHGFTVTMPDVSAVAPDQQTYMTQALESIGIKVKIAPVPLTQLFADLLAGKFALSWFKLASYQSWNLISTEFTPTAIWNPLKYSTPTLNALVDKAQKTSGAQQTALYQQINTYVQQQAFNAPWDVLQAVFASSPKIQVTPQAFETVVSIYNIKPAS